MSADNNVIISVTDLKKYYNDGEVKALDGVTTDIRKGEVVVVIGPSGSGKSTFLRSLNLLERPTSGKITFDGQDIMSPSTDINKLRQKMGMVFQHFNLFPHLTILRNMTIAPMKLHGLSKEEAEKKAMDFSRESDWRTVQCISFTALRRSEAEDRYSKSSRDGS